MTQYLQQTYTNDDMINSIFKVSNPYMMYDPNIQKNHQANIIIKYGNSTYMNKAKFGLKFTPENSNQNCTAPFTSFNTKVENIEVLPCWLEKLHKLHCIIPVSGFYQWSKHYSNIPYLYSIKNQKVIYIAGFYSSSIIEDTYYKYSFSTLTRSVDDFAVSNHSRIPVVLNEDDAMKWLQNTYSEEMIINSKNLEFETRRVSRALNNPTVKDLDKIYHL